MIYNISTGPESTILDYLNKQYRPYSTTDIIQNLHGEIGRAAAVKAIEALVSDGKIVSKLYGKVVVSCANKVDPVSLRCSLPFFRAQELMKILGRWRDQGICRWYACYSQCKID
ncbi:CYFA0S01e08724g1_1 [Cyberlindnera fabianii]|uniref:CYFA0S01e08724g1_1 n=1 Tax=Cyberlindnera fabianii TaxID=36022 RepID=A0A061AJC3_CYBFA|nr:CYFA0S01e08724g1_1 [Cyberlindnera fabianii]